MSNLIITIISIALAAIVALLGIYYGGQAYNNYQIKSQANTVISQMSQLYNAGVLYITDTNQKDFTAYYTGANPATNLAGHMNTLLTPNYLSSMPVPPNGDKLDYTNITRNVSGFNITLSHALGCLPDGGFVYAMCGNAAGKNHTVISWQKPSTCSSFFDADEISGAFGTDDRYVKIAREINRQTTVPSGLTINGTVQLPVSTRLLTSATSAATSLVARYCPGTTYEMDNGCVIRSDLKQIVCFFAK